MITSPQVDDFTFERLQDIHAFIQLEPNDRAALKAVDADVSLLLLMDQDVRYSPEDFKCFGAYKHYSDKQEQAKRESVQWS